MHKPNPKSYLSHYGIQGQKWGIRRYQNPDGTLTEEGKRRYSYGDVTVERTGHNGKEDYYKISQKGRKSDNNYYIEGKSYRAIEEGSENKAKRYIASQLGTSMKDVDNLFNSGSVDTKAINEVLDQYARDELVAVMDYMDNLLKEKNAKEQKPANANNSSGSSKKASSASLTEKYANTKMSQSKAIKTAYADLEKMYPNFNDFSQDKQDELFFDYLNESGLYRWI